MPKASRKPADARRRRDLPVSRVRGLKKPEEFARARANYTGGIAQQRGHGRSDTNRDPWTLVNVIIYRDGAILDLFACPACRDR
jgi:hypothetical protein